MANTQSSNLVFISEFLLTLIVRSADELVSGTPLTFEIGPLFPEPKVALYGFIVRALLNLQTELKRSPIDQVHIREISVEFSAIDLCISLG
jgi:hypothetical protein